MRLRHLLLGFSFLLCAVLRAQSVVVSAYFNAADPRDEWIELVVVTDNTDMRNWTIRDNNSSQTSWQTAVTFQNVALWNNLRAGTVIMIWNRIVASDGTTAHPSDLNKNDGYLELYAHDGTNLSGGVVGSSPTWSGNSLNFAGGGDVIQLRNSSGTHVHALGHINTPGADWNALPSPKLNHANSASSGEAIYVCPGSATAEFGTSAPQNGTTWTTKNNSTITFGLPNTCGSSATGNTAYWNSLREPAISPQTVTPAATPGNPGSMSFSWTGATDPNPSDNTTGYLILRNTSNSFTAPSDGTTYVTGGTLGGADILAQLTPSTTTSCTDNTVMNGNTYYYRVYAFRYATDNLNGNSFHQSRGRAYNTTGFVQVDYPTPLPVELLEFSAQQEGAAVRLTWSTATETNNDFFTVERSQDGSSFENIVRVDGAGNSSQPLHYSAFDPAPQQGINYYRLRQTDFNGQFTLSAIVPVHFKNTGTTIRIFTQDDGIFFSAPGLNGEICCEILDLTGRCVYRENFHSEGNSHERLPEHLLTKGLYFLRLSDGMQVLTHKFLRQ